MSYRREFGSRPALPPVLKWVLIANVLVFILELFPGRQGLLEWWLGLWPNGEVLVQRWNGGVVPFNQFYPWQLITYGFLHANITHIFFNLFGLWMFGQNVEEELGSRRFFIFYFVCVIGAGLTHIAYAAATGSHGVVIGASGGVFGVLLAFGMLFPRAKIMMLFFPVPIEARFLVMIYGGLELFNGVTGRGGNVAHFAHLGGMFFGWILLLLWTHGRKERRG